MVDVTGKLGLLGGAAPGEGGHNVDHLCLRVELFDRDAIVCHLRKHGARIGDFGSRYGAEGEGPSQYLLDPEGTVGKAYGAKTTPHMYVIDGQGVLRYMGGIDSIQSADAADIPKATQYVKQALAELSGGKPVSVPVSQPYGCSVKYGSTHLCS